MPSTHPHKRKPLPARRPTETVAGLGGLAVTYGFLTQAGVSPALAAVCAVVAGAVPAVVTYLKDRSGT